MWATSVEKRWPKQSGFPRGLPFLPLLHLLPHSRNSLSHRTLFFLPLRPVSPRQRHDLLPSPAAAAAACFTPLPHNIKSPPHLGYSALSLSLCLSVSLNSAKSPLLVLLRPPTLRILFGSASQWPVAYRWAGDGDCAWEHSPQHPGFLEPQTQDGRGFVRCGVGIEGQLEDRFWVSKKITQRFPGRARRRSTTISYSGGPSGTGDGENGDIQRSDYTGRCRGR